MYYYAKECCWSIFSAPSARPFPRALYERRADDLFLLPRPTEAVTLGYAHYSLGRRRTVPMVLVVLNGLHGKCRKTDVERKQ